MTDYDNSSPRKRRRIDRFDDIYDDRGQAFREIFTRDREGPLQPRPSGKGGGPMASAPPTNTGAPVASGSLAVGSVLSTTNGTWTGSPTFTYQWLRGGVNIAGATSSTYTTVTADGGTTVSCRVTATNVKGSASATSNGLAITALSSVWSAADAATNGMDLTNGGLTATFTVVAGGSKSIRNTISRTAGKLYIEFLCNVGGGYGLWGLGSSGFDPTSYFGNSPFSVGMYSGGSTFVSTGFTSNYTMNTTPNATDVWALAVDFTAGSVWLGQNNVWFNSSNPATGSLPIASFVPATVGALFAGLSMNAGVAVETWTIQPTAASQKYAPPAGFSAWG